LLPCSQTRLGRCVFLIIVTSRVEKSDDKLKTQQLQQCKTLARDFINGPAKEFLSPCNNEQEREQKLVEAINEAADISFKLWSQRARLDVRGLKDFKEPFDWDSPHLKVHMVNQLTRRPHSRDGDPIALFVQPEIIACGNEEGEDYDKEKIWCKAVVALKPAA